MSGAAPRVSVGMPVYNGARYVEQALNSLLAQDFTDFELVISDNGSTDRTEEICRRYGSRDARITYHRHGENRGAAWNYNFVFHRSRGEYFKWAAHDDNCAPAFLSRCVATLDKAPPSVVACYPRAMISDEAGRMTRKLDHYPQLQFETPEERLFALVTHVGLLTPVFGLIRSSALQRTRLIGAYISSDRVLLAELALMGRFVQIPDYLLAQRVHAGMSTQANRSDAELAAWFDPSKTRWWNWQPRVNSVYRLGPRLCMEHLVAIARSDLSGYEKRRCGLAFLKAWRARKLICKALLAEVEEARPGRPSGTRS